MAKITKIVISEDDAFHGMVFLDVYDDRKAKNPNERINGYGETVRLWSKEMSGPLRINFKKSNPEQMLQEMTDFIKDEANAELEMIGEEAIDTKHLDAKKVKDFFKSLLEKTVEGAQVLL